jgi:hypothetical protein
VRNVGGSVTYADSATLGASFTINKSGIYTITSSDHINSVAVLYIGLSLNSTELTTNVQSIIDSTRLDLSYRSVDAALKARATLHLKGGSTKDVVRPHTDGSPTETGARVNFRIKRIG